MRPRLRLPILLLSFATWTVSCQAGLLSLIPGIESGAGKGENGPTSVNQDDLLTPDLASDPPPAVVRERPVSRARGTPDPTRRRWSTGVPPAGWRGTSETGVRGVGILPAMGAGYAGFSYDVAIVPFRGSGTKDKDGAAYSKIEAAFAQEGLKVAPRARVVASLKQLGLLSSDALARSDLDGFGGAVSARYLVTGNLKTLSASLGLNAGMFLLGSLRFAAAGSAVHGGISRGVLLAAGGLGLLAAGVTLTAAADLDAQIYDHAIGKTIWLGEQSRTRKKYFLALFKNKSRIREQALSAAVTALFKGVVKALKKTARL